MRTTIRLEDDLLRRAKAHAAAAGRSLNDFIADAVRGALARRPGKAGPVELPTWRGRGLQRGVDLDDSAALLDVMEEAYPVRDRRRPRRVAEKPRKRRR